MQILNFGRVDGLTPEELAQLQRSANTMREMIDKLDG